MIGANVTSYASTGLSRNTLYYYRVRATNASGNSATSNTTVSPQNDLAVTPVEITIR